MKQVISLVLLGLFCSNGVLAGKANETKANGASQSGRVINGYEVNIANYRYPLILMIDERYSCGASIITASHALTAAHCVNDFVYSPWRVTLYGGSSYVNRPVVRISVGRIAVHPYYNTNNFNYDAAVLTVPSNAFAGNSNMAGIALQNTEVPDGTRCFVVGWGRYDINRQETSNSLRYTNLYIVSNYECSATFGTISPDQVCSKNYFNMETCSGDSGSALVCNGRLTGIVSFGVGDNRQCTSEAPTVFAKVFGPTVREFIRRQTGI
uniref:Uncharacterized protein n=1 Tax=Anopheles stephensi TaxID=30069 RepID=A0A182XVZ1_ANOST